jgi:membrane-associated phospholipid phosphatase
MTLVPMLLWYAAVVHGRAFFIKPWCAQDPSACSPSKVFLIDRIALGLDYRQADSLSFLTQNTSGYLAISVPALWIILLLVLRRKTWLAALSAIACEIVLAAQSVSWNGVFTELAHASVHRPRPFVYGNPGYLGADFANYTSFYSGHTSFTAAACSYLFLALLRREAPPLITKSFFGIGAVLIVLTGAFRVFSGRHFITDVVAGAVAGILVSVAISRIHRHGT